MTAATQDFIVNRTDLTQARWVRGPAPTEVALDQGQVLVEIEKFAFTANNITYAVAGDMLNYWAFFPAEAGWGRIPVWGYATVVRSRCDEIAEGGRLYGYFPMSSHLVMQPESVTPGSFLDLYQQRRELHPVYNTYSRLQSGSAAPSVLDDLRPLLSPLYTTSFLIDDWLADNDFFGATQALLLSASSKTGFGLAFALSQRRSQGPAVLGLTSPGNIAFVESLGCYDSVLAYDSIATLDASRSTLVVDFAGDGDVLASVHRHFGDGLVESTQVGLSHWDAPRPPADLPGAKPHLFFAPDQARKRMQEWGREGFDTRLGESWRAFAARAADWISIEHGTGPDAISKVYSETLAGHINPAVGNMLSP
ncbi:DUF2855 family protein [Haliea sp. E1-2-M8]|uniref:DUF2855 family protein n=1 Tax=Haliea sp. E1-2-M8 TaxID=3064706 RepID=UPI00271E85A8|nr:DUF2855 family protein [Haliea sp. E1-2-M8]MDO8862090.1 DUF2855 family protein [Haliea sp. E1-2-M8]